MSVLITKLKVNDRVHVIAGLGKGWEGWRYVRDVDVGLGLVQVIGPDGDEGRIAVELLDYHLTPGDKPNLLPAWTEFRRYTLPPLTAAQIDAAMSTFPGMTREQVELAMLSVGDDAVHANSRYQVNVRYLQPTDPNDTSGSLAHLSIKRLDKTPVGSERYRDFMRIKDELMGTEREAVEIYPGRSREVDTANQYHLWVLPPMVKLPFGFDYGKRVVTEYSGAAGATDSHVQAAFEEHHVK